MEAQCSHIRNGAIALPFIFRANDMGSILNQHQIFLPANRQQFVQFHRLPGKVHCHHCFRLFAHLPGYRLWVNIISILPDIRKHRPRPTIQGAVGRSRKSDRRSNHFIARPYPCCHAGYMQRRRSVAAYHRIFRSGHFT